MRMRILWSAVIVTWGCTAFAADTWPLFDACRWSFPSLCKLWQQRKAWCPDDYHCKPLPGVTPNPHGCVDDYCPKTCPIPLPPPCEPWYTCGSLKDSHAGTYRNGSPKP